MHDYYIFLSNASFKLFTGEAQHREQFEIINERIANQLVAYLSPIDYANVIFAALQIHETECTETFMHTYETKLMEWEENESCVWLCKALVHFAKGEYEEVLDCLYQTHFNNFTLNLMARMTRIKTYCEVENELLLAAAIKSCTQYMNSHLENRTHNEQLRIARFKTFLGLSQAFGEV